MTTRGHQVLTGSHSPQLIRALQPTPNALVFGDEGVLLVVALRCLSRHNCCPLGVPGSSQCLLCSGHYPAGSRMDVHRTDVKTGSERGSDFPEASWLATGRERPRLLVWGGKAGVPRGPRGPARHPSAPLQGKRAAGVSSMFGHPGSASSVLRAAPPQGLETRYGWGWLLGSAKKGEPL